MYPNLQNYILDIYRDDITGDKVLAVNNVLWCNICKPVGTLIPIDFHGKTNPEGQNKSDSEAQDTKDKKEENPPKEI